MRGRFRRLVTVSLVRVGSSQPLLFLASSVLGALIAVLLRTYEATLADLPSDSYKQAYDWSYERWLEKQGLTRVASEPDLARYRNRSTRYSEDQLDPDSEAAFLFQSVKVFCLVFPTNAGVTEILYFSSSLNTNWTLDNSAKAIKETWGKRCNRIFFHTADEAKPSIPIVRTPSKSAFGLLCDSIRNIVTEGEDFHWLLVTTESTFALPENLRPYVAPFDSSKPYYLGHAMKFWNQVYNWGEAGYALSRGAVAQITSRFNSSNACQAGGKYWKNADWYLGKHLGAAGVKVKDTRDHLGRGRFNGYSFRKLLFPGAVSLFERYWKDSIYLSPDGPKCCSSKAVTFQGILSTSKMYQLEYLFHHLRPFAHGGVHGNVPPPPQKEDPFLTEEERLKAAMMQKWFDAQLMTTPSDMHLHHMPTVDY